MNTRFLRLVQFGVMALDMLSLNILIIISQSWLIHINETYSMEYVLFWLWINASWLLVCRVCGLYHEKYITVIEAFSKRTIHVYIYWLAVVFVCLFFTRQYQLSRLFIAIVLCSQGVMLLVNRFIYLGIRFYFRQKHFLVRRALIVGYNSTAKKLASYLEKDDRYTVIAGYCEDTHRVRELTNYPIVSSVANVIETARQMKVDEIYSTIAPEHNKYIYKIMQQADQACIRFRVIPDMNFFINRAFHVDYLHDMPVLSVRKEPLEDPGNMIKKKMFDIGFSLLVVIFILSWMIPLLGLLIWLESGGSIFFKQMRSGKNNEPFQCLKFRSMRVNKESDSKQATANDSRLTRVGRFLRKTNLDEFPQFINVLRGDMSIIGPRPHMLKHTDDYSKIIDQYMIRQFVKPGITGWAQVNGYRGETRTLDQMEGRINLDIWYAENWSLWLDVRIIFLTIYTTIKGNKNAY